MHTNVKQNKESIRYYISPKAHALLKRAAELENRSAGNLLDTLLLEQIPKIMKKKGENADEYYAKHMNYDVLTEINGVPNS
jgi:hypothetical protein